MKLVIISLLVLLSVKCHSQDKWINVGYDSDYNIWEVYKSYVTKSKNEIKIWIKETVMAYTSKEGKLYLKPHLLKLIIVDCYNKKYKIIKSVMKDKDEEFIDEEVAPNSDFIDEIPGGVMEQVDKKICELYN